MIGVHDYFLSLGPVRAPIPTRVDLAGPVRTHRPRLPNWLKTIQMVVSIIMNMIYM